MVRSAVFEDIKAINDLGILVNKNFDKLFDMNLILNENISKVFVYEKDNEVLGFIHITDLKETIDIINIVVRIDHQRENIGSILMDYVISEASPELKVITLEVAVDNEAAINLYKKFGFDIINIRKEYYGQVDAYLMGRKMDE